MELLILLLYILFSVRVFHGVLLYAYLWQLKEYRLDRMMDLLSTPRGRSYFLHVFFFIQLGILIALFFARGNEEMLLLLAYVLLVVFIAQALKGIAEVFTRAVRRPRITLKSLAILFVSVAVAFGAAWFFLADDFFEPPLFTLVLALTVLSLILSDIVSLAVFVMNLITGPLKRRVYRRAMERIRSMPDLTVIGITGSYGKTTTKEFLIQMLSKRYNVLATSGNTNTEMGVANEILRRLKPEHEVFVIEMGAYKKGEIKTICDIVKPAIGVLTAVSNQHLGLFGSIENIADAKFELIESLPDDGLAVFNADNEAVLKLSQKAHCRTLLYSIDGDAMVRAAEARMGQEGVAFQLHVGEDQIPVASRIAGGHNISNILAAVSVAQELGMTLQEIAEAIAALELPRHHMSVFRAGENVLIDSTYNTNQTGCEYSMVYLKNMYPEHTKIMVFPGILELGSASQDVHLELGLFAGKAIDYLIVSSEDFAPQLIRGFEYVAHENKKAVLMTDPAEVARFIRNIPGKKVVLFESRGMERALTMLKQQL